VQKKVGDHHEDVRGVSYSRSRELDVELTMGKYRERQVDCDFLEGLPMGFVDSPPKKRNKKFRNVLFFSWSSPALHTKHPCHDSSHYPRCAPGLHAPPLLPPFPTPLFSYDSQQITTLPAHRTGVPASIYNCFLGAADGIQRLRETRIFMQGPALQPNRTCDVPNFGHD